MTSKLGAEGRFAWRRLSVNATPNRTTLEKSANIATICASIVASCSLWFGYYQFKATQELTRQTLSLQQKGLAQEREAKAVDMLMRFNEIQRDIASSESKRPKERLFWQRNAALITTEAVYQLTVGDKGWLATVRFMLKEQVGFLKAGLDCDTLAPDFVKLIKEVAGQQVCMP